MFVHFTLAGTTLNRVRGLVDRLRPELLVIEDHAAPDCRRADRVRHLMATLEREAATWGVSVRKIRASAVRRYFAARCAMTKLQRAELLARLYPELATSLPPVRKQWMSEDERMAIFDAAGLALCAFVTRQRNRISSRVAQTAADSERVFRA